MTSENELRLAYALAAVLLIVGIFSYAAFSTPPPEYPVRIMFQNSGGKVLFDHRTHYSPGGYGVSCGDCHHTLSEEEYADAESCSACHEESSDDEDMPGRKDSFHRQCGGCHEEFGAGPAAKDCSSCHVL